MSSDAQETRDRLLRELAQELRQLNGLSAAVFRAMAARLGVTTTDMQVIESLASSGPMTAGQLAELTGLTTGAITGMLNRLEEAGLVRRERDPEDGRRVIVRIAEDSNQMRGMSDVFEFVGKAWEEATGSLDDEQLTFLVEVLQRGNDLSRKELEMLREAPQADEGIFTAPLENVASGRLLIPAGMSHLAVRGDLEMAALYRAQFEGTVPEVKAKEGVVTIRYPRRPWLLGRGQQGAEVTLNASIPWEIAIRGGASDIRAELGNLDLIRLEIAGGMSMISLDLPVPSRVVPIHFSGGASQITVRRPAGVPAGVHLKGWASAFIFDGQTFGYLGKDVRLTSPGWDGATPGYEIEIASSVSTITITAE